MDNWDDFRFVVALARFGSMSQAAKHLRSNTATVSRRIRRISDSTGMTLFHKTHNDWELTEEGRKLFELASSFGDDLTAFQAGYQEGQNSERQVRVASLEFMASEFLAPRAAELMDSHPNVTLEVTASDQNVSLAYGEADIALRLTRPTEGRLVAKRIARVPMGVFATTTAPQAWIGLPMELDWTPEMKNGRAFFGTAPALRLPSFRAISNAALVSGLGAVLPECVAVTEPRLTPLQPRANMRERELWLVFHETRKNDAVLRDVCQWIEDSFRHLA